MPSISGKRPKWVWVISIFYIVSFLYTCLSYYLILTASISLDPTTKAYFKNLTWVDWILTFAGGLLGLAAAIALWMLRKQALYIFWASLGLSILAAVRAPTRAWLAPNRPAEVGMFLGWAILVSVCFYVTKLTKAGVLH